jgi:hypothetical protein
VNLSILCITKAEPHAFDFLEYMAEACDELQASFVVAPDGADAAASVLEADIDFDHMAAGLDSKGYLESIHDEALAVCPDGYVLRLDDDEYIGDAFIKWLAGGFYTAEPLWKFARAHIWTNTDGSESVITNAPLWPDHQTRLGKKQYMGGRNVIHCGSPYGGGAEAPVYIEHHKFTCKTLEDREEIVARYNAVSEGSGTHFSAFSVPERVFNRYELKPLGNGYTESIK